jgi:trans-aconitate methyltransferase
VSSHFEISPEEYERSREGHMQRRRQELVSATLRAHAVPNSLIVELGCGPGSLIASLADEWPGKRFLGLDLEERMIEHARRVHVRANLSFDVVDLQIEAPPARADVVFSVDLVHHVHDLPAFLGNVRRLLATGGAWVLMEPNMLHPYVLVSQERMRRRGLDEDHFRSRQFESLLSPAGLAVENKRTMFVFPGRVGRVPRPLASIERAVERVPFLGGSVAYVLRAT